MTANGKPAPAIPSMGYLAGRSAEDHARALRLWARQASLSSRMKNELLAAAQFIEEERKEQEQHGLRQ